LLPIAQEDLALTDHRVLTGRIAIVTGAGSGIGAAIALELAHAGAHVVAQDLRIEAANETVAAIQEAGGSAQSSQGDVTRPDQIRRTVDETVAAWDRVDILVNNAGLQYVAPIDEYPLEKWNQLLAVLLTGPFLFTQAVLPAMRAQQWGRIVNIASINGKRGDAGKAAYCSAKHGVIGLTRTVALETARDGITVNAVCPGLVMTPLIEGQIDDLARVHHMDRDEVIQRHFVANIPTGRATEAAEIASLIRYLASDEAASITGQAINVSGGLIMH
jgi:3-hydroxybutyrate dehydrogenase